MTNKRKMQRSKRAQNDTILRRKRCKYQANKVIQVVPYYDLITATIFISDQNVFRAQADLIAKKQLCGLKCELNNYFDRIKKELFGTE